MRTILRKQKAEKEYYKLSNKAFEERLDCSFCHTRGENTGQLYFPNFYGFPIGKVVVDKDVSGDIHLRKCKKCGLLYKDMVVTLETQSQLYKNSDLRYNYKSTNKLILRKMEIIRKLCIKENPHLLDIGCHTGDFLKVSKSYGFRTSGSDYSETANVISRNYIDGGFYQGLIEDIQFPKEHFDIITAWDVFEHLYDVCKALEKLYIALKPGGYLFIETGNVSSMGARVRSPNNWWYVCGLSHLNFYDIPCIEQILKYAGFIEIKCERVYHKSICDFNYYEYLQQLVRSLLFAASPKAYKYVMGLIGRSGGATALPCKDHIFVYAKKPDKG